MVEIKKMTNSKEECLRGDQKRFRKHSKGLWKKVLNLGKSNHRG